MLSSRRPGPFKFKPARACTRACQLIDLTQPAGCVGHRTHCSTRQVPFGLCRPRGFTARERLEDAMRQTPPVRLWPDSDGGCARCAACSPEYKLSGQHVSAAGWQGALHLTLACLQLNRGVPAALLPADCPAYLSSEDTGLPVCDMSSQEYLDGSWQHLPERCQPSTLDELASLAYAYEQDCTNPNYLCDPAKNPIKPCAPAAAAGCRTVSSELTLTDAQQDDSHSAVVLEAHKVYHGALQRTSAQQEAGGAQDCLCGGLFDVAALSQPEAADVPR